MHPPMAWPIQELLQHQPHPQFGEHEGSPTLPLRSPYSSQPAPGQGAGVETSYVSQGPSEECGMWSCCQLCP